MQYFSNVRQNSAALAAFAEVVKVTNHSGLWDAELAWYSSSTTRWPYFHDLKQSESTVLNQPDLAWSLRFLSSELNFLNPQAFGLWLSAPSPFGQQLFMVASVKLLPGSLVWLSNYTWSKTMQNVSAHLIPRYYQPQLVPFTAWSCFQRYLLQTALSNTNKIQADLFDSLKGP